MGYCRYDIEFQYEKDTEVTFSYETDAKRGNLCFSVYERQGEGIKELKEICESKRYFYSYFKSK